MGHKKSQKKMSLYILVITQRMRYQQDRVDISQREWQLIGKIRKKGLVTKIICNHPVNISDRLKITKIVAIRDFPDPEITNRFLRKALHFLSKNTGLT